MADSIEQKIITAIVARMQLINGSSPYLTAIGERVEDSRPNWQEEELPAMSVFQDTVTPKDIDDDLLEVERSVPVHIQTFHKRFDTAAEDAAYARKVMQDVMRAIRTDPLWKVSGTALATATHEGPHGIEYVDGTYEISGTQTTITVKYFADYFNMEA